MYGIVYACIYCSASGIYAFISHLMEFVSKGLTSEVEEWTWDG